jgi:hypothetical protein
MTLDSPYQVYVQQGNCEVSGGAEFYVTVWARQSTGELYERGTFPAEGLRPA